MYSKRAMLGVVGLLLAIAAACSTKDFPRDDARVARLLSDRGRRDEAQDLLAPVISGSRTRHSAGGTVIRVAAATAVARQAVDCDSAFRKYDQPS